MPATIIALVDRGNRYGLDVLSGIDEIARPERWRIVLADWTSPPPAAAPAGVIGFFRDDSADPWRKRFRGQGTHQIRFGEDVVIDEAEVGRCAARHLVERGLVHGATVSFNHTFGFTTPRCAGFGEVMPGTCPAFSLRLVEWEEQVKAFVPWLRSLPQPVGILAANDHVGRIVLMGCAAAGLQVPEQCAVLGVDNDPLLCLDALCPLSSVRMPHVAMGTAGAQRLRRLLAGEPAGPVETVRPGSVCARLSTDVLHCADEAVSLALAWLQTNYASPFGIDAAARASGVSRRTLERRFCAVLGRSLHDQLRRVRITRARELLARDADLPVAAVAAAVGLSPSAFMTAFATETGSSPGAWRAGRVSETAARPGSAGSRSRPRHPEPGPG